VTQCAGSVCGAGTRAASPKTANRGSNGAVLAPQQNHVPEGAAAGDFYDEVWGRYGHLDAASPAAFHRRRLAVELCVRHAAHATRVLDAGCGRGELVRELRRAFPSARLAASDVSLVSTRETQRENPSLEVLQMDLSQPDFDTAYAAYLGQFALITCCEVVEHIPDDRQALRRLSRLLAPGGTLVLTVPGGKMSRFDQLIGHQRHYSSAALLDLSLSAGLDPLEVLAWGFPFQNLYRAAVRVASRWSMPSAAAPERPGSGRNVSNLLGAAYALFGRALKPLFYVNRNYWGEQMLLVARKR